MSQPAYPQRPLPPPPPPNRGGSGAGMGVGLIIVLIAIPALVAIIGILAVMSIYGTRKYIANAKTAEARNTLGMLGKLAVSAYERDGKVCPSASQPVPASPTAVSAKKYMSTPSDWDADKAANAGFACLKFEMSMPQYFQYDYKATSAGFTATARGDLNGNGVYSEFKVEGRVIGGVLQVAPTISETNPEE